MEQALLTRLESAVARLETLAASGSAPLVSSRDLPGASALDPAISAFEDLVADSLGRVSASAGKIGGQVLDATKILEEAFAALRELLVKAKRSQVGPRPTRSLLQCPSIGDSSSFKLSSLWFSFASNFSFLG